MIDLSGLIGHRLEISARDKTPLAPDTFYEIVGYVVDDTSTGEASLVVLLHNGQLQRYPLERNGSLFWPVSPDLREKVVGVRA